MLLSLLLAFPIANFWYKLNNNTCYYLFWLSSAVYVRCQTVSYYRYIIKCQEFLRQYWIARVGYSSGRDYVLNIIMLSILKYTKYYFPLIFGSNNFV